MRKIKFFFRVLGKSLTDFSYYKEIAKTKFSFSFKYLIFLVFLISFFWGVFYAFKLTTFLPKVPKVISDAKVAVSEIYPKELVLMLQEGKLTTNVREPYFIEFPDVLAGLSGETFAHLVAIDTKAEAADFAKYQSPILLTGDSAVFQDKDYGFRVVPLTEVKTDLVVTRPIYDEFIKVITPYFDYFPSVVYALIVISLSLLPLITTAFSLSWRMITLFFLTVLLWVVSKVMKKHLSFGKVYQLSMHGVTLPVLLGLGASLVGLFFPTWLFIGVFLVFMGVVISKFES